jgi:hypothetical protein
MSSTGRRRLANWIEPDTCTHRIKKEITEEAYIQSLDGHFIHMF